MTVTDPPITQEQLRSLGEQILSMDDDELADYEDTLDADGRRLAERAVALVAGAGWRASPLTMGIHFGDLDDLPHTRFLAQKFVDAVEGRSSRQIWNLPPQHGKSLVASRHGPRWAFDVDPSIQLALTSYGDQLARENAIWVRDALIARGDELRARLRPDRRRGDRFVTDEGGGLISAGVGSGLTGFGAHGIVVDDPFKNWEEAHSEARRSLVWNWYWTVVRTRLNHRGSIPGFIIIVMCMTGDTPVLMADGTERALRDVRPGDCIATYEDGQLKTSTVRRWANQGPDNIYEIRMKSGVVVRANARHPFLTVEDGVETWRRTDMLKPGSRILRATGASGEASPVPRTDATSPRNARACACPITTRRAGRPGIVLLPSTLIRDERLESSIGTASPSRTTTDSSPSRTGSARVAANPRPSETLGRTGTESSASTTTTKPARFAACFATIATSSWDTAKRRNDWNSPLRTFVVAVDEVIEVVPAGIEDVFDLQVDRTENFIANGLVSHNTRWHEQDLTGRLVEQDLASEGENFELVVLPALAEDNDLLGRKRGEPLAPTLHDKAELEQIMLSFGSYLSAGLYQQRPAPEEGGEIKRGWWKFYDEAPPKLDASLTSWDMKMKDKTGGDFVVGQAWGRTGSDFWLLDQLRGQWNLVTTKTAIALMAARHPDITRHVIENTGNGPEVMEELRRAQPGYEVSEEVRSDLGITDEELPRVNEMFRRGIPGMLPQNVKFDKIARARAQSGLVEAGNCHLPRGRAFSMSLVDESAAFPNGSHDDQVDAWSQAMKRLRRGSVGVVPTAGRTVSSPKPGARSTDRSAVRFGTVGRPRGRGFK